MGGEKYGGQSRDTGTYRDDTPHPITTAPMVLLIVGITVPRLIVERESWSQSSEGGG